MTGSRIRIIFVRIACHLFLQFPDSCLVFYSFSVLYSFIEEDWKKLLSWRSAKVSQKTTNLFLREPQIVPDKQYISYFLHLQMPFNAVVDLNYSREVVCHIALLTKEILDLL